MADDSSKREGIEAALTRIRKALTAPHAERGNRPDPQQWAESKVRAAEEARRREETSDERVTRQFHEVTEED